MANTRQLQKRTGVEGRRPGIADIQLGEIAINTHDGKMFIKRDVNGSVDIIQVGDDKVDNVFYVSKSGIKGNLGTSLQDAFSTLDSAVEYLTVQESFTFNEVKCRRDFGLIFDGLYHDIAFGTNYNAVTSGLSYQRASAGVVQAQQLVATRSGFNEAKGAVASVPEVKSSAGVDGALQRNNRHWSEVVDILVNGATSTETAADTLVYPEPPVLPTPDANDAVVILRLNRAYLKDEVVAYITANYPSLSYNETKCRRDVGFIVDALCFDLMYGGDHGTHIITQSYFVDGVSQLPATQQAQSVASYTHLANIMDGLVRNALSGALASGSVGGGNGGQFATTVEGNRIKNDLVPIFTSAINANSLSGLAAKNEPNYTSRGVSSALRSAISATKLIEQLAITQSVARAKTTGDTTIFLKSGDYAINNPLKLPPKTSIVGDNLRTVTIRPQSVDSDLFYMDNGTFIKDVTFRDHQSLAACVSFDPSVDSPGAGPFIIQSPYVQNCTSITTDGVGMRIDGSKASGLKSMVSDAFTQYNAAGFGVQLLNRGYAQLVSMFTISTATSISAKSGGQCSIANSNASFGDFGLVAEGSSPSLYRGQLDSSYPIFTDTVRVNNILSLDSYSYLTDLGDYKKPNYNDAMILDSEDFFYTVTSVDSVSPGVYDVTFQPPLNNDLYLGAQNVNFHQRSQITTSSHTFEYVGAGTNTFTAIPQNGGIPSRQREVVFDSATQEGLVVFTSTDQLGDFRIGADLTINRAAGRIEGETFERSLFAILTPYILALEG